MGRSTTCALLVAFLISACRGGFVEEAEEVPLEGPTWTLHHMDVHGDVLTPPRDETYSLHFDGSGVLRGRSDCNDCEGTFHLRKSDSLVISFGCTEAACGPSGSSLGGFSVYARGVFGYRIDDARLTLEKRPAGGTLRLVFDGE